MKKALALMLAGAMSAGLLAGCGSAQGTASGSTATGESSGSGNAGLSISWWGGDSRHTAYQNALAAFTEETGIEVSTHYGAWSGWEDQVSAALYSGNAEDVMQVGWVWLTQYSGDGSKFVDLNEYADIIDLSQFPESTLEACTVAGKLQAIPVSMTGRIFYWNMNTFKEAGLDSYPTTLDELYAAGEAFQTNLGDDYYPLALGEYDRMLLMTYYLESTYGKPWVEDNTLQYTVEEIATGIDFIQSLEDKHVIPSLQTMNAAGIDGNNSIDKSEQWINGMYAGIFEWDSAATKYQGSLSDPSGFTVGDEIKFGDKANGGFSKVSMGLAITETCQDKEAAAQLINFLLNGEGAAIIGSECGIPNSAAGLAAAEEAGVVDELVLEANTKVMEFVDFSLDPTYESNDLKANPGGAYTDTFGGYSYGEYADSTEAAQVLYDGVTEVLEDAAKG